MAAAMNGGLKMGIRVRSTTRNLGHFVSGCFGRHRIYLRGMSEQPKRTLVTSALPYANGPIHIGHIAGAYLPADIIVKTERMSMAHSLEARCPLLDQEVVELAAHLPIELKFRRGRLKHLLREVALRHVPASLVNRKKQGFGVPVGSWFREELRELHPRRRGRSLRATLAR